MFSRIKNFFGFGSGDFDGDLASGAYKDYDNLFHEHLNQIIRPREIGYMEAAWYRLRTATAKPRQGVSWAFGKIFNTIFYLVSLNISVALFARTIGFLAAGSFGWAALAVLPAYIALRSTGPIYDVMAKVVGTIAPKIFSGLLYVAKKLGTIALRHTLSVTGIADYARTVPHGEFFGKAKLPAVVIGNKDDEHEPNPDLNAAGSAYGPEINLGPLSFGSSLRFSWSLIKYIKHLPQYIKHGLNWAMKKSGLEEFARCIDTPLQRQESEYRLSSYKGYAEIELSNFEVYLGDKNNAITELSSTVQQEINTYIETFPDLRKISKSDIETAIKAASEQQKQFIQDKKAALDAIINNDASMALAVSQVIENNDFYNNPEAEKIVWSAIFAKQRMDSAFNSFSRSIVQSKSIFESAFEAAIAVKPEVIAPENSSANPSQKASPLTITLPTLTPEEDAEFKATQEKYHNKKKETALLWQKKREENNRMCNLGPAKSAMDVALEQDEESKRRSHKDEEKDRYGTEQLQEGGRSYNKDKTKKRSLSQ